MAYQSLEKLINLEEGYRRVFRTGQGELLLLHEAGETVLIDRHCPHAGQRLDDAPVRDGCIVCPLHLLRFSLRDGRPHTPACKPLGVYPLVYEGNTVGIDS